MAGLILWSIVGFIAWCCLCQDDNYLDNISWETRTVAILICGPFCTALMLLGGVLHIIKLVLIWMERRLG